MIKHAALVTVVATAGLLYTALTRETDLAEFDRKELEALIESPRPALTVNPLVEDHRQQFARLMMDMPNKKMSDFAQRGPLSQGSSNARRRVSSRIKRLHY